MPLFAVQEIAYFAEAGGELEQRKTSLRGVGVLGGISRGCRSSDCFDILKLDLNLANIDLVLDLSIFVLY